MNTERTDYDKLDHAYHLHSFTHLSEFQDQPSVVIERGDGIYLIDTDGNRYLDAMSSLWCATLGYSEPRLANAAKAQLSKLPYSHTFRGRSNDKLVQLAQKLVDLSPAQLTRVFFATSGSEANESAIKLAWSYHKSRGNQEKRKIISRMNGYHGSTIFSTRLTGMPQMHEYMNVEFDEIIHAEVPNYATMSLDGESEIEFSERLADQLESQIQAHQPQTIAAMIAEPVMGVGGVIVPPKDYFERIQPVLKQYDILLIADEVVCGFGRTGNMFGSTTFDMQPDLLTVAKGLTSAYFPMSAVLVTEHIYEALVAETTEKGVFSHGFTYSGHPVGAAVALETITILEQRKIIAHVNEAGKTFQAGIHRLNRFSSVVNTRGVGLMAGFDLQSNKFAEGVSPGALLMDIAERNGLFIRAIGDTVVLAPPLIISESEIEELMKRLDASLVQLERE